MTVKLRRELLATMLVAAVATLGFVVSHPATQPAMFVHGGGGGYASFSPGSSVSFSTSADEYHGVWWCGNKAYCYSSPFSVKDPDNDQGADQPFIQISAIAQAYQDTTYPYAWHNVAVPHATAELWDITTNQRKASSDSWNNSQGPYLNYSSLPSGWSLTDTYQLIVHLDSGQSSAQLFMLVDVNEDGGCSSCR